jgi:hypothetical protein
VAAPNLNNHDLSPTGIAIARALRGSWRQTPEPLSIPINEFSAIESLLLRTGAGALAWRRVQQVASSDEIFPDLKNAYRSYAIEAAINQFNVRDVFHRARQADVEPLLLKGWALARLYPDDALRPYGDIDLWLQPNRLERLNQALPPAGEHAYCVEPHTSFYRQYERSFEDLLSQSKLIALGDIQVRVPCDEDHLRFICLHFLFHGGWRPLWLCDVGLMVESAGSDFDWDRCLRGTPKYADWIACTIALAHQLLGAEVGDTPFEKRATNLPQWLVKSVLKQWEKGPGMSGATKLSFSLTQGLREPQEFAEALRQHWRNPVQACVEMDAPFNRPPRRSLQIGSALSRVPAFAGEVVAQMRFAQKVHDIEE